MGFAAPATTAELDTPDGQDGDGRTLRRTRNRERVIIALLDIVRSGELNPTVAGIADLAGVSHRSVFRYFDDLDDLVRTAIDHEVEHSMHLALIPDLGMGSLDRRVDSWVESRLRVHSATYQVGRVARHRAPGIPSIDIGLKGVYLLGRTRMRAHFANELDAMGADGGIMLDAAMVLTGFESYDVQHRVIQHSTERIRQIWLLALHELFTRTPEN
jgi:AcrR family transcriptional regulator